MGTLDPRWENIFAQAMDISDANERAAFVERACGGDEPLRQEVEALLRAHRDAGDFMNVPPEVGLSHAIPSEQAGDRIGRYKLLEQIGEGGFGVVWMAEQEEPVHRRVALKIIKLGMDTKEVVARFEAERQALAMMNHPNIATVFDGGATATGRPYFVMELVKGIPITKYCDEHKLTTRERLELSMQVCQAVQHAHQKGVIHRDLKPSNILVTETDGRPVPKVIDFGVAKATSARLTEKTVFTRFHQLLGTPAYMSPEQAGLGSLDVDTRSDVYSLGVLLYELLTGRTPFDTQKLLEAGYEAVMRTIREEEPPKPSTRLSTLADEELNIVAAQRGAEPAKLGRLVRGDLDWIVMKALEKDRTRRYETANALARDLEQHLSDKPVSAMAPGTIYTVQKFIRRHLAALAAVTALLLILVSGAGVSLWQAARANREAREAAHQRTLANNEATRASTEATRANRLLQETERSRGELESALYRSQIGLAYEAWEKADVGETLGLLEGCPPKLRGWEWNYLHRQCNSALLSFDARAKDFEDPSYWELYTLEEGQLVFSPDGARLGAGNWPWGSAVFDSFSGQRILSLSTNGTIGQFSEDGSAYFLPPHAYMLPLNRPGQIVEIIDGTVHTLFAYREIDVHNGDWMASQTNSTVVLSCMRKADEARTFAIPGRSSLAAISRDGRWLVSLDNSNYTVWNSQIGKLLLQGPFGKYRPVFRFDEAHLQIAVSGCLTQSGMPSVALWDLATAQQRYVKPVGMQPARMVFSPNGDRLSIAGATTRIQIDTKDLVILDTRSGKEIFGMRADNETDHGDRMIIPPKGDSVAMGYGVTSVAFSPDGSQFALGVMDRTVQLVESKPPFRRRILKGHRSAVCAVAFSSDGKRLASMDRRGAIRIWDASSFSQESSNDNESTGWYWWDGLSVARDGSCILLYTNTINLQTLRRHTIGIPGNDIDFHGSIAIDQSRIAAGQGVWDISSSNWISQFTNRHPNEINVSRDGKLVAVQENRHVVVWDAARGIRIGKEYPVTANGSYEAFSYQNGSSAFSFSPDNRLLAVATETNTIAVHRLGLNGDLPAEICRISGQYPLCFGPTGDWLLANRPGGGFLKADSRSGAVQREFALGFPSSRMISWDISSDGRLAVCYCFDIRYRGVVSIGCVISLETGQRLFEFRNSAGFAKANFSPDGSRLAAPGSDNRIRLWNLAEAKAVATLPVRGLFTRFSADGTHLVVIGLEGDLSVLDGTSLERKDLVR